MDIIIAVGLGLLIIGVFMSIIFHLRGVVSAKNLIIKEQDSVIADQNFELESHRQHIKNQDDALDSLAKSYAERSDQLEKERIECGRLRLLKTPDNLMDYKEPIHAPFVQKG